MLALFACSLILAVPPTEGIVTAEVGDWSIAFDAARAWTIHHIDRDGRTLSHHHGFHGTVIDNGKPLSGKGPGFVGTGHQEAGAEIVEDLVLELDGEPVEATAGAVYRGERFVLRKRSRIDQLLHHSTITVTPEMVTERHQFEAVADQPLKRMYAFMHCWQPTFTRWAAETPDGTALAGTLDNDKDFEVNDDVAWSALFDPAAGVGVVTSYPAPIIPLFNGMGTRYWDLDRYHKQYLEAIGGGTLEQGTALDWTLRIHPFTAPAEGDAWIEAARTLARTPFAQE